MPRIAWRGAGGSVWGSDTRDRVGDRCDDARGAGGANRRSYGRYPTSVIPPAGRVAGGDGRVNSGVGTHGRRGAR